MPLAKRASTLSSEMAGANHHDALPAPDRLGHPGSQSCGRNVAESGAADPPAVQSTRVTIEIPATVYTGLTLRVKDQKDAQGQPLTVTQWIANLATRTAAAVDSGASRDVQ